MEIELPYNVCKTGESSTPQFPLYVMDRNASNRPDAMECLLDMRNQSMDTEQEIEGKKDKLSISKYFGVDKTHGMYRMRLLTFQCCYFAVTL